MDLSIAIPRNGRSQPVSKNGRRYCLEEIILYLKTVAGAFEIFVASLKHADVHFSLDFIVKCLFCFLLERLSIREPQNESMKDMLPKKRLLSMLSTWTDASYEDFQVKFSPQILVCLSFSSCAHVFYLSYF